MRATRIFRPMLAASAAVALTGCGGGLGKEELAEKANAICAKASQDLDKLGRPSNIGNPEAATNFFARVVPIAERQLAELRKLEPASDIKADWDAFVAKEAEATDLLRTVLRKARAKDSSGIQDLQSASRIAEEVKNTAAKVGATSCR